MLVHQFMKSRHLFQSPVALAAGRVQMAHHAAGVAVESKADMSPVTIADHQSEEIILEALRSLLRQQGMEPFARPLEEKGGQ